jgi:hypothetical protein
LILTRASARGDGSRGAGASATRIVIPGLVLFLLCLTVYNSNLRVVGSYDSLAPSLIPFGLWRGDGLLLDGYRGAFSPEVGYSIVQSKTGHLVSLYPPVTPILAAPLYFPAAIVPRMVSSAQNVVASRLPMEKIAGSVFAALSVVVLHSALRRVAPSGLALALTVAYAFGTSTWAISSQSLWQHGPATLLLSIAILLLLEPSLSPPKLALLGLCTGLITANRPMDVFFSAAIAWIVVRRHRSASWLFFVPAAIIAIAFVSYNLLHFGTMLGGYGIYRTPSGESLLRRAPDAGAFLGLLFSNRGLFTFSPFLLFLLVSPFAKGDPKAAVLRPLLLACLCSAILYASADGWSGGYCYGPRYLVTCLPVLTLALVAPLRRFLVKRRHRIVFASAVGISVAVQAIGAYCFPGGDSGNEGKGLWSVRNASPVLAASAGPQTPDFLSIVAPALTMTRALRPGEAVATYEWSAPPPSVWDARSRHRLRVWIRNDGSVALLPFGGFRNLNGIVVRATWRTDGGHSEPARPLEGTLLSENLSSGEAVEETFEIEGPNTTGRFRLSVELEQVGVAPFSKWGSPPLETEVLVRPGPGFDDERLAAEWEALEGPLEFAAGGFATVPVRVRNVSRRTWSHVIDLSYRWNRKDGTLVREGIRTRIPAKASSWIGATVPASVRVDVPPGEYVLSFDLVVRGLRPHRFEEDGSRPLSVKVRVK